MILINADDFGWLDGQNLAVERAHRLGILNRASLLCNGPGFDQAVAIARKYPDLGVGVHLTLNESRPLLAGRYLPHLTTHGGYFHETLSPLVWLWVTGRLQVAEVLSEWRVQVERAIKAGVKVGHLDSHKHVHMLPPLLDVTLQLAAEYRIPYVRLPLEPNAVSRLQRGLGGVVLWLLELRARSRLMKRGLSFADRFYGLAYSGAMTLSRLKTALHQSTRGVVEVMVHPAVVTPAVEVLRQRYRWAARYCFEEELEALCAPEIQALFRQKQSAGRN